MTNIVERVAKALLEADCGAGTWDCLGKFGRAPWLLDADKLLRVLRAAGLTVVPVAEPDGWAPGVADTGEDAGGPYWDVELTGRVMAFPEGVDVEHVLYGDLGQLRADVIKLLAAVDTARRYRVRRTP